MLKNLKQITFLFAAMLIVSETGITSALAAASGFSGSEAYPKKCVDKFMACMKPVQALCDDLCATDDPAYPPAYPGTLEQCISQCLDQYRDIAQCDEKMAECLAVPGQAKQIPKKY